MLTFSGSFILQCFVKVVAAVDDVVVVVVVVVASDDIVVVVFYVVFVVAVDDVVVLVLVYSEVFRRSENFCRKQKNEKRQAEGKLNCSHDFLLRKSENNLCNNL